MHTPVDGSTPATPQRLQQALAQRSGAQLHLDPGDP
jgi:hypothetical protein